LYDLPRWVPTELRDPQRWDVVVFKFPQEPQVNYIKRLVGLPNEELRIRYGNLYTRSEDGGEFEIARKTASKQRVMRMLVYDNDHQSPELRRRGWPSRWQSESGEAWIESRDGKSFESPPGLGESTSWARLAYHNLVKVWGQGESDERPPSPQLVTDFYAYNAGISRGRFRDGDYQPHWVGDLAVSVKVDVASTRGRFQLELVEAGERFICEFDLAAGSCRLLRVSADGGQQQVLAHESRGIRRTGKYSVCFANTDDRLTVWLDDMLLFGDGIDYSGSGLSEPQVPTEADLRPAVIAVQGARVNLSDLVLYRDIYYTHGERGEAGWFEYEKHPGNQWEEVLSDPTRWSFLGTARVSAFSKMGPDEFMMMGDNSPRSKDGRLWESGARYWVDRRAEEEQQYPSQALASIGAKPGGGVVVSPEHVVHRQLLIGRAFFVYWPHGVPFGPDWLQFDTPKLGPLGSFRLPFFPNISRMKMIE
jgi:signal peptidase I